MLRISVILVAIATAIGCSSAASPAQDVSKLLVATDVKTGWFDAGVENGMNKLVPAMVVTLKNVGQQNISLVQLNAVIRRVNEKDEWGGAYIRQAIGSAGLAPGASTPPLVLKSNLGYTGTEPRAVMLKNSQFVDAHIQLFAKQGGSSWAKLGEYPIARELLTQ
jgi:hypothetical protein